MRIQTQNITDLAPVSLAALGNQALHDCREKQSDPGTMCCQGLGVAKKATAKPVNGEKKWRRRSMKK